MYFRGIDFHNVEELESCEKGYIMWRLPKAVREKMNEGIRNLTSRYSTGVELRFKMVDERADVILCAEETTEANVAYVYYGSLQAGWQSSSFVIGPEPTRISLTKPTNLKMLEQITMEEKLPFSPEVVRIVLPYGKCCFCGVEGKVALPTSADVPKQTYLAYGSSITHGSLALAAPYSYPFRIAQKLKMDYINMGFAGTAQLEGAMADYIVSRKDWNFASVEMGINMLNSFSVDEFEERVDNFTQILAEDERPIYATNIFQCQEQDEKKVKAFRDIVRKYASARLIFTEGTEILSCKSHISADSVHPSLEGMEDIVRNWSAIMEKRRGI